jgi:hypothetical protein
MMAPRFPGQPRAYLGRERWVTEQTTRRLLNRLPREGPLRIRVGGGIKCAWGDAANESGSE